MLAWFQSQFYKTIYIQRSLHSIPVPFYSLCPFRGDVNIRAGTYNHYTQYFFLYYHYLFTALQFRTNSLKLRNFSHFNCLKVIL